MASTVGRMVVDNPTNKSGGALAKGDVVVVDTTNDHAITTSTAGAVTGKVGVVIEENGIANNASGRVQFAGYVGLVNVNASVTRGHYGKTHTVAKQATDAGASRVAGTFCQFESGGTTPAAWLFGNPDLGAAAGNVAVDGIWDAAGDLAVGTGADAAARLAIGTAGKVLTSNGTTAAWADPVAKTTQVDQLAADVTLTGAGTFVDGPTLTLAAGTWLLAGNVVVSRTDNASTLTAKLWDGTTVAASGDVTTGGASFRGTIALVAVVVLAGSTTYKISAACDAGGSVGRMKAAAANGGGNTNCTLTAVKLA